MKQTIITLDKIPELLDMFEEDIELLPQRIGVKGKTIKEALRDQSEWYYLYEQKRCEVKKVLKYTEQQLAKMKGKLFQTSVENYQRDLSDRARDKYIEALPEVNSMYEILLDVEEMYDKYCSATEAFKLRGFALRDHTTLLVNSLQDTVL